MASKSESYVYVLMKVRSGVGQPTIWSVKSNFTSLDDAIDGGKMVAVYETNRGWRDVRATPWRWASSDEEARYNALPFQEDYPPVTTYAVKGACEPRWQCPHCAYSSYGVTPDGRHIATHLTLAAEVAASSTLAQDALDECYNEALDDVLHLVNLHVPSGTTQERLKGTIEALRRGVLVEPFSEAALRRIEHVLSDAMIGPDRLPPGPMAAKILATVRDRLRNRS